MKERTRDERIQAMWWEMARESHQAGRRNFATHASNAETTGVVKAALRGPIPTTPRTTDEQED